MFKRSRDLTDKWPNVFPFFKKFLKVKGNFVAPTGGFVRGYPML